MKTKIPSAAQKTSAVQKVNNGDGFILHKIPFLNQRISAWFSADGSLVDAEFMPSARQVKKGGPAWRQAADFGKRYK